MNAADPATPVLPFTRGVFVLGVLLTAGTGIGLVAVPGRTAGYWAWTIASPLSASFFGAGYLGAAVALGLAARDGTWRRTRAVAISALVLTSLALLATARNTGPFAFHAGGLTEAVAWIWLAVYVALPPLLVAAFVLEERRRGPWPPGVRAFAASRVALGAVGTLLVGPGIALVAGSTGLAAHWPWPLPALPAAVVGAWLCAVAAPLLWFALVDPEWDAVRIGVAPIALTLVLDVGSAVRCRDSFASASARAAYVSTLVVLLLVLSAAALAEERRPRLSA